ncbi:uncharacterized protein DMENIID0001_057350 [Sergentomyia squamirostris]
MKSLASSEASASKSSSGHKKSSSGTSKSKSKKFSQHPANSSASSMDPTASTSEKGRCKNFAGISPKSVKCYWEQHEKHDTDVSSEACSRVAEDVTYKLWELGNTLKTYARHSGGRVTTDLVNEALKDSNICPVLGAGSSEWDTIECEGVFHFNKDRIVDLREEYLKDVEVTTSRVSAGASWLAEETMSDDLLDFVDHLCDAVFLGEADTFNRSMVMVASNPYMGCIVKLLLNKCTELLSFEYKQDTLRRAMELLVTLSRNPFARDAEITAEIYYLCQVLVCVLLGPANQEAFSADLNPSGDFQTNLDFTFHGYHSENGHQVNVTTIENPHAAVVDENLLSTIAGIKSETSLYNGIDITDIKNECEAVFIMMDNNGLEMKRQHQVTLPEQSNIVGIKSEIMDTFDQYNGGSAELMDYQCESQNQMCFKQEDTFGASCTPAAVADVNPTVTEVTPAEQNTQPECDFWREEECGVITTQMCDFDCVEMVCQCLGRLGSVWGLAERRCCNLIRARLKEFFNRGCLLLHWEFEWVVRAFRAMWALGENPFREFSVYLERIDPISTPEWVLHEFHVAALYIRGSGDSFLYDILYTLCGDSLLPFMVYNTKKLNKIAIKSATESQIKYKIVSKVLLKVCPRITSERCSRTIDQCFDDRHTLGLKKIPTRIGFRFAGCRPVILPRKSHHTIPPAAPAASLNHHTYQNAELLAKFNQRVVVAKRKLFTPLTNKRMVRKIDDLRCVNL